MQSRQPVLSWRRLLSSLLSLFLSTACLLLLASCASLEQSGSLGVYQPSFSGGPVSDRAVSDTVHSLVLQFDLSPKPVISKQEGLPKQAVSSKQAALTSPQAPSKLPDLQPDLQQAVPARLCADECFPAGTACRLDMLSKCKNNDDDPCLEQVDVLCTYGCTGSSCRKEAETISQSDLLHQPLQVKADKNCLGRYFGDVRWNPEGGLCRSSHRTDTSAWYNLPKDCCQRYYSVTSCVTDLGAQEQDKVSSSPYHLFGCFSS
ncbi:hypothetical protein HYU19_04360 [Candidatus Woesearchaeota archaeon]|nr:hypothetical protein [Candidatus Woesearchaeota archaeon]